jgi:hypothetical protein
LPVFSKLLSKLKRHMIFTKVHLPGEKKANFQKPSESIIKLGLVAHAYGPSYSGGRGRKIAVRGWSRQSQLETLSEKEPLKANGLGAWLKW